MKVIPVLDGDFVKEDVRSVFYLRDEAVAFEGNSGNDDFWRIQEAAYHLLKFFREALHFSDLIDDDDGSGTSFKLERIKEFLESLHIDAVFPNTERAAKIDVRKNRCSPVQTDQAESLSRALFPDLSGEKTGRMESLQFAAKLGDQRGLSHAGKPRDQNVLYTFHIG